MLCSHSFLGQSLRAYRVPVTVLGTGDVVVNKTTVLSLNGADILVEAIHEQGN